MYKRCMHISNRHKTLVFIGFQATGKTTLGRLVAHQLGWAFVDTDHLIEQCHPPLSCSEIFKTFGTSYFRDLESQVITSLRHDPPFVLALGGGSVLRESNYIALQAHSRFIYLKSSPHILKERIWQRPTLPSYLSGAQPHEAFDRLYQERLAIYEKWADDLIEMDDLTIEQALKSVFNLIS